MSMERNTVEDDLLNIPLSDFDDTTENVINMLREYQQKYVCHEGYISTNLHLYYFDVGEAFFTLSGVRLETDQEYERRLARLEKAARRRAAKKADEEARERAQLMEALATVNRLGKKYGMVDD